MTIYFKVAHSWHFLYQHTPCIVPTKYTILINTNIKWVYQTCFGTVQVYRMPIFKNQLPLQSCNDLCIGGLRY